MKLFHYPVGGHRNNHASMIRMCKLFDIEFIESSNPNDLDNMENYDILWLHTNFIDPNKFPPKLKILYGPQLFVFPTGPICGQTNKEWEHKAVFNCLSPWIKEVFNEISEMKTPLIPLPFGVNTDKFKPLIDIKDRTDYFIYSKYRSPEIFNHINKMCGKIPHNKNILIYGSYNEEAYLKILQKSRFGIWIGCHESQGFALQEALSCDVPLIVLNVKSLKEEFHSRFIYDHMPQKLNATTVSYWSNACGEVIYNVNEFIQSYTKLEAHIESYKPRNYILENLSDSVCMKRILDYFEFKNTK